MNKGKEMPKEGQPYKTEKVFVDTNVLFSAFYGSVNCGRILNAHSFGEFQMVVSKKVIEELVRNTPKKPAIIKMVSDFLRIKPPKIVNNPVSFSKPVLEFVDIKDQIIFQAGVNAKAKYFVTGNIKDFSVVELERVYKIKILTPAQIVDRLGL